MVSVAFQFKRVVVRGRLAEESEPEEAEEEECDVVGSSKISWFVVFSFIIFNLYHTILNVLAYSYNM